MGKQAQKKKGSVNAPVKPYRQFESGATRDLSHDKIDYYGFFSPLMIEAFGAYMHYNRFLADGSVRDSDNWKKGIPQVELGRSLWRHFYDVWRWLEGFPIKENIVWAICGAIFNLQGLLHALIKDDPGLVERCREEMETQRQVRWAQGQR